MSSIDLASPMRQSRKGILIIFAYQLFSFLKKTFILLAALIFTLLRRNTFDNLKYEFLLFALGGFLIFFLLIAFLRYNNFKFYLKNDEFYLKTGILNKETIILSKSKIQNIYIKETFLHRLIGVVALNIESAGDKNSEIEITALDKNIALLMKQRLIDYQSKDDQSEPVQSQVVYKVTLYKLFLEGLTQNHIKSLTIIFSFVLGLYFENKDFVEELNLFNRIADWMKLNDEILNNMIILNIIVLIVGLLISIIFSTVKMVIQNFNLKVVEQNNALEISKGLIQTMTLTLLPERIQNLVIKTNILKQKLGLYTLSVKQAMVNEKQANNFSIVGLNLVGLNFLTNTLSPDYRVFKVEDRVRSQAFYKRVLAIRYGVLALIVNAIISIAIQWYVLITLIVSLAIVALCVRFLYQKTYFYFDDLYLTKGSGLIETKTNIMALHKIQSVCVNQNIFQKRRHLASMELTTASQKIIIPYIKKSDADKIADYLLYKVESQQKDWM